MKKENLTMSQAYLRTIIIAIITGIVIFQLSLSEEAKSEQNNIHTYWYQRDRGEVITDEGELMGFKDKKYVYPLRYPLNRVQDVLDIISLHIGFGLGAYVNAHATRAMQVGVGTTNVTWLGIDHRQYGLCQDEKHEFSLLPLTLERSERKDTEAGVCTQYDSKEDLPLLYQKYRDYWGIGAEVTGAIVNVGVEVHPLEILDALVGITTIDLLGDDPLLPRWEGNLGKHLTKERIRNIKRIVIVPSRIIEEKYTRIAQDKGAGVYYARYPLEVSFQKLGTLLKKSQDLKYSETLSKDIKDSKFDIYHELLKRASRDLEAEKQLDVIEVDDIMKDFELHKVKKSYKGQKILRLPNYPGLAEWYGADAILDIRIWEWGIWRYEVFGEESAIVKLDCEYKMIDKTGKEVLFDIRVLHSYKKGTTGTPHGGFMRSGGSSKFITESKLACDAVNLDFIEKLPK
jgi:hypothetical protein